MSDLIEKMARTLCRHDEPCWSIVSEIMNEDDPMFERVNAACVKAIGMTRREWYLQMATKALQAIQDAGMVIVPREPTEAMKGACERVTYDCPGEVLSTDGLAIYKAMITAHIRSEALSELAELDNKIMDGHDE